MLLPAAAVGPIAVLRDKPSRPITAEIDTRLAAYAFDQHAINTEVYVQAREIFVLFESLLNAAQTKRTRFLREIRNQRLVGVYRCVSGGERSD
ncbi:hypothetical protein ACVWXO_005642 [Bradyrhizobium sp. LM2.7]